MQTHAQKHMAQYPARPTATPEILLKAGMEIENELNQFANWRDRCKGLGQALSRIVGGENMNGYELAKQLESNLALHGIDGDAVEVLDGFGYTAKQLITKEQLKWAKKNKITPPFPVGTRLASGTIRAIYPYQAACYEVDVGNGQYFPLIDFEKAVSAKEQQQATAPAAAH